MSLFKGGTVAVRKLGYRTLVLGILVWTGCEENKREKVAPAEGGDLAGQWEIVLRLEQHRREPLITRGTLLLEPDPVHSPACADEDPVACATAVTGTHNLDLVSMMGYELPSIVDAGLMENGAILIQIGGCCDRGEISALGRLDGEVIRGKWSEGRVSPAREGTFVLRRVGPHP